MKILVCTDGSEHSGKAVEEASKIAEAMKGDVTILHVYKRKYAESAWALSGGDYSSGAEEIIKGLKKLDEQENIERAKVLDAAAEVFKKNNIKANKLLEEGHPAKTICEVASNGGFDLIVIGSRGRGGFLSVFLGSVSNAVAQNCKTKILIVK